MTARVPFEDILRFGFVALLLQVSMEHTFQYNDYPEDNSWNNCTESAAVLAQLRLNQALNSLLPPNGLHSDTWQVGPSVSQQETIRYLQSPSILVPFLTTFLLCQLVPLLNEMFCIHPAFSC